MEQILTQELPQYLSLRDRNNLCSVNKKYYQQLRPVTPSGIEVERKRKVDQELQIVTRPLYNSIDLECPLFGGTVHRVTEYYREYYDHRYDGASYISKQRIGINLLVPKNYKPKYIWFPFMCHRIVCDCNKIQIL